MCFYPSLQGRLIQKCELEGKDTSDPVDEDDEMAEVSGVPVVFKVELKMEGPTPDQIQLTLLSIIWTKK